MKFDRPIPVRELAESLGARLLGNAELQATGINEIHKVEPGDITFVDAPKYYRKALHSAADIILIDREQPCPDGKALLVCPQPFDAYDRLVRTHRPHRPLNALQAPEARIHPEAVVEPGVVIGPEVHIGAGSYIQSGVVLRGQCRIGAGVVIQSGTVVGADAFYFQKNADGSYRRWHTAGRVLIEDEVFIGANCTICAGVSGDTVIGRGSKLDCQVHVGHGVVIGKNCLIAGQVGIGGKATLEDGVVLYGQVGLAPRIRIGAGAVVGAQSGVSKDLPGGKVYFGSPADELRTKQRELAALRQLPLWLEKNRK
ncbi:MAG: UDP-3-O-(3-hydroxymyristoyl)glucosamine N-acyltransferase [Bacteroidetes bacterium]|nr:MAG: UDP-3-O-(3-hydroxymyristoyl)glucosamine N-acyltransferase [Bacteroidota bacterium]